MKRNVMPPHGLFQGRNFVTPEFVEWGHLAGEYYYELSKGVGPFTGTLMVGVTVRPDPDHAFSRAVWSLKEALAWLRTVERCILADARQR